MYKRETSALKATTKTTKYPLRVIDTCEVLCAPARQKDCSVLNVSSANGERQRLNEMHLMKNGIKENIFFSFRDLKRFSWKWNVECCCSVGIQLQCVCICEDSISGATARRFSISPLRYYIFMNFIPVSSGDAANATDEIDIVCAERAKRGNEADNAL